MAVGARGGQAGSVLPEVARLLERFRLSYPSSVKVTRYFVMRMRDRPEVQREWCQRVLAGPARVQQQADGKYQMWGYIAEVDRYLRVITLEDRETVDNAFFDRSFARKKMTP